MITHFVRIDAHILDNFCWVLSFIWYSVSSQFYENLVTAVCSIFFCYWFMNSSKIFGFTMCFNPFPQAYFWASFCWVLKEVYLLSFIYSVSSQFLWELSDSSFSSGAKAHLVRSSSTGNLHEIDPSQKWYWKQIL